MYFYRQLAKQFFQNLYIGFGPDEVRSQLATEKKEPNWDTLSEGVLANLSPEQRKLAWDIEEQIANLQKEYEVESAGEKINGAWARNIESSLTEEDMQDPDAQSLLERLEMYKRRLSEATGAKENVSLRLSALSNDLKNVSWVSSEVTGSIETEWEYEISPESLKKFRDYVSEKAREGGIPESVLLSVLSEKYDFTGITDSEAEKKLTEEYLSNVEWFDEEISELIADWKSRDIQTEWPEAFTQENVEKEIIFSAIHWSDTPVSQGIARIKERSPSLDDGTIAWKILEFLRNLFGIDMHKDGALSTLWGSEENLNRMLSRTGDMNELGSLSAFYESGERWPEAINGEDKDQKGNAMPSMGSYQMRAEPLGKFSEKMGIKGDHTKPFTWKEYTEFALNWQKKVQEVWKEAFQKAEHEFIKETHYDKTVSQLGLDISKSSMVVKNVIWSTSVQHWPGTSIIKEAIENVGLNPWKQASEASFIKEVYRLRSVAESRTVGRYKAELRLALGQLQIMWWTAIDKEVASIRSVPKRVTYKPNGKVKMTYCAETSRLNLEQFWKTAPKAGDATNLKKHYAKNWGLSETPQGNLFQYFSRSNKFPEHGHVATGFVKNGKAYILDPYLPANGKWQRVGTPIPLETYISFLKVSGRYSPWPNFKTV